MDEESKNINNEDEESLVDSSSNSNTINRGIDNFGNSVNNLKNNQSHQLSGVKSLGTNFKKDAKNNELANKLTRKPVSPSSRLGSGLQNEQGESKKETNSEIKGGLTSKIAGGGVKGSLAASLLGNKKKKEEQSGEAPDIFEKAKKTKVLISIIGAIGPVLFPIVVIIILITVIVLPISFAVGEIKNFIQRASNFNEFNGFKTNHELADELYEKADKAVSIYPDLNRESLLGVLYYSYITPEEYLNSLNDAENSDAEDKLNFGRMKKTLYTMASQLIYSTVTFDNNILRIEDDIIDPDTGKVVGKKVRYECPGGAYKISTRKQLCKDGIANYTDGPGDLDYSSADMCYDITSDANIEPYLNESGFDKNMKCVTVNYETNTENSKAKVENFLRYALLPNTYFRRTFLGIGYNYDGKLENHAYKWKKMASPFSNSTENSGQYTGNKDEYFYNIPMYKIGPDKKIDYYSSLSEQDKKTVEDAILTIDAVIDSSRDTEIADKYYIKGAVSLPLDFTIKEPIENSIGPISSKFGQRIHPITGKQNFHKGIDFPRPVGTPIYSFMDGVVVDAIDGVSKSNDVCGLGASCGIGICIEHDIDGDNSYDYRTIYCHMSKRYVNEGSIVNNGQQIGSVGSTGNSTGPHLHFEIREKNTPVDPIKYLIEAIKGQSTLSKNNNITSVNVQEIEENYYTYVNGKSNTREGVATSAQFLVDNLAGLPYFCGGYTQKIADSLWYTTQMSTCDGTNKQAKYGMDDSGFVSWALTQNGFANKRYTTDELMNLGESIKMYDSQVKVGDIAYRGNRVGIIIQINDDKAVIAYADINKGLTTATVDRTLAVSLFPDVISMDKVYNR